MGFILLAFLGIRFIVSFINLISKLYLPKKYVIKNKPFVSVLIPARNEAKSIGKLLNDLVASEYVSLEIIVYNDQSYDDTMNIVHHFTTIYPHVKLINGSGLKKGWLGKNYACYNLAKAAKGEILLFLDADVRVGKKIIEKSIAYLEKYGLDLLSIFPKQILSNIGVKCVVPIMNWILLSLLPMFLIRYSSLSSLSAANGQFMMFNAKTYQLLQPHELFRGNAVEDIAIIREYKKRKLKTATLLGDKEISCKMYGNLPEAIDGFSKNIFQFFGGTVPVTVLFLIITTITPFYLYLLDNLLGLISLIMIVLTHVFVSLSSKQSPVSNVVMIIPQQITFWVIVITAIIKKKERNIIWKERNIYENT